MVGGGSGDGHQKHSEYWTPNVFRDTGGLFVLKIVYFLLEIEFKVK